MIGEKTEIGNKVKEHVVVSKDKAVVVTAPTVNANVSTFTTGSNSGRDHRSLQKRFSEVLFLYPVKEKLNLLLTMGCLLMWNVRGLNKVSKQKYVKEL